jgi:hypothetical protein
VQLGTENRKKVLLAGGLGLLAIVSTTYSLWSPAAPPRPQVTQTKTTPAPRAAESRLAPKNATPGRTAAPLLSSLDPSLQLSLLKATEQLNYTGSGRNIFSNEAPPPEIPKPVQTVATDTATPVPQGPPPPPPITLKFFGFASRAGEAKKVFLSQGEDVFIAAEGDIVNRRYKVVHISPNSVDIEDVLYNNRQSIPLTQG